MKVPTQVGTHRSYLTVLAKALPGKHAKVTPNLKAEPGMSLDHRLHGTWALRAFDFIDAEGAVFQPLGPEPLGGLVISPDGHVSFQFFAANRRQFATEDLFGGTDEEWAWAARGAVVFGGPCRTEGGALIVDVTYSLYPNWIGGTQRRLYRVEGDRLMLGTDGPALFGDVQRRADVKLVRESGG
jgi:hypothetical protein